MKLFSVEYLPEENEGVYALSVVKNPAMQSNWITLSEQKGLKLATIDEERRILMGIALIPNKPIYRSDEQGEYNIIFSSKVIEQAAHDFVKKGNVNNSTLEHEIDLGSDAVSVVESWVIEDAVHDKTRKYGFKEPVGSWAVMMKVHDDATWEKAKSGEILGFSIDGLFNLKEISKPVNMNENVKSLSLAQKFGKFLLGLEEKELPAVEDVKLMSVKTADGMEIMYEGEALEAGVVVFIENEGERVPLPVGDYDLEDGKKMIVAEEGVIAEIAEGEAPQEVDESLSEDEIASITKMMDKLFGLSELKGEISKIETKLSEIKSENEGLKVKLSEFGNQPAVSRVASKAIVTLTEPKTARERILAKVLKNKN